MDEALIRNWNECVQPSDTVFHLGDFCYRNSQSADVYLGRLNGEIHLIAGNHDGETLERHAHLFKSVHQILELRERGHRIVLCHYPMREWHGSWRDAWHLFGHVHGRLDDEPRGYSLDVGVDSHYFRPWSLEQIEDTFSGRENIFAGGRPLRLKT
jgi:calcineurin-like phosphoesterase family protein